MTGESPASEAAIAAVLGERHFEWDPLGVRVYRERANPVHLREIERRLASVGDVRILDFRIGSEDLRENLVGPEAPPLAEYAGAPTATGSRVFRIDHHYDAPEFEGESTTPLVLRYVRALRDAGRGDVLGRFARSRFLADHADPDILFANHVARSAERDDVVAAPLGDWLAAAAIRNDYIRLPDPEHEPFASRLYYAGLGLEEAILFRGAGFANTLRDVMPHLGAWLAGRAGASVADALDRHESEYREKEERVLREIDEWRREGRLSFHASGRVAVLEAPKKTENADLFLYFARRNEAPDVQILRFPRPSRGDGHFMYKLRAHGGRNLSPVYRRLRELWPAAGFDGRSAAGGSRVPIPEIPSAALVDAVLAAL